MFNRLTFEGWQLTLAGALFIFFFALFVYLSLRATRMSNREKKHLAELPFSDETPKTDDGDRPDDKK